MNKNLFKFVIQKKRKEKKRKKTHCKHRKFVNKFRLEKFRKNGFDVILLLGEMASVSDRLSLKTQAQLPEWWVLNERKKGKRSHIQDILELILRAVAFCFPRKVDAVVNGVVLSQSQCYYWFKYRNRNGFNHCYYEYFSNVKSLSLSNDFACNGWINEIIPILFQKAEHLRKLKLKRMNIISVASNIFDWDRLVQLTELEMDNVNIVWQSLC